MEGVRVSSYVSVNSWKLHVLSRFDYVRVCVCTYVSHLPSDSSRHLPSLLRGGEVHLLQVRERVTRVRKRKDNAHTQRGAEERKNESTYITCSCAETTICALREFTRK